VHLLWQWGALAGGLSLALYLFCTVKRELRRSERRMEEFRTRLEEPPVPSRMPPAGIDLSRRAQALRMRRRGEAPASVASALGLPGNQVELLWKVEDLLAPRKSAAGLQPGLRD